jgi:dihydroorotate dehydrogenase (fumarate)
LELNVYYLPTNPLRNGAAVEEITLNIVRAVRQSVSIPVAVKLSPYYSSLANLAAQLAEAGANGLVLFNRFYQPDLDIDELEVVPGLKLSTPEELRLPLRWVAILYGRLQADLAITTGVHSGRDVLKSMMAGAQVAMVASELLQNGPERLASMVEEMRAWMQEHEYESVAQMRGSMSQRKVADPGVFERANYMRVLQAWRPDPAGGLYRQIVH